MGSEHTAYCRISSRARRSTPSSRRRKSCARCCARERACSAARSAVSVARCARTELCAGTIFDLRRCDGIDGAQAEREGESGGRGWEWRSSREILVEARDRRLHSRVSRLVAAFLISAQPVPAELVGPRGMQTSQTKPCESCKDPASPALDLRAPSSARASPAAPCALVPRAPRTALGMELLPPRHYQTCTLRSSALHGSLDLWCKLPPTQGPRPGLLARVGFLLHAARCAAADSWRGR